MMVNQEGKVGIRPLALLLNKTESYQMIKGRDPNGSNAGRESSIISQLT